MNYFSKYNFLFFLFLSISILLYISCDSFKSDNNESGQENQEMNDPVDKEEPDPVEVEDQLEQI